MSSFRSTERPPVPRAIGPYDKWLADPVTGAIVGIQNPNAGGKDTMIGPIFATLAQLQNPTPAMLEMTGAVFMLSTAPYSRYYSNGEALIGEGRQPFDRGPVRNVGHQGRHFNARCERGGRGVEGAGLDVGEDEVCAFSRQSAGGRQSDPARPAGDHCGLAVEVLHGSTFCKISTRRSRRRHRGHGGSIALGELCEPRECPGACPRASLISVYLFHGITPPERASSPC